MKKTRKKQMSLFLVVCLTVPFLMACTSTQETTEKETAGQNQESVQQEEGQKTITVWYWEDNDGSYEEAYAGWQDRYPNVTLELESVPWNSYHDMLLAAAASGNLPDVYKIQPSWIPELRSLGAVIELDNYIEQWAGKDTIPDSMWQSAKADQEAAYAWPHSLVVLYLYCRKSYFEEAGIDYPTTMEEFYQACEALTRDTDGDGTADIYGFSMRGARGGHFMWAGLTLNNGTTFFDGNGQVTLDTPEMAEANQKYLDIYLNGWAPKTAPTDGYTEIVQNFQSGVAAMLVHHLSSAQEIQGVLGDDVEVVALPEGAQGRYLPSEPCYWAISSQSEHTAESVQFLEFASEAETHKILCKSAGLAPFITPVTEDPEFTEDKFYAASMEFLEDVQIFPVCNTWGDWSESVWPQTMQRAMLEEITSEEMISILADNLAGE